jgi:hypothetical protein
MALLIGLTALKLWRATLAVAAAMGFSTPGMAQEALLFKEEMELKVAFIYNFALFTEWPATVGSTLTLCILGRDSFGLTIDELQGKAVGGRNIIVQRLADGQSLRVCQITFISASAIAQLPRVLGESRKHPMLTMADSPGAARQGVALNLTLNRNKISFEGNLLAASAGQVKLSSKLLRLATEVIQ